MRPDVKKFLYDIAKAASHIELFTSGRTWSDYQADVMLRSAVERQFEIIGEALSRLARVDEQVASRISDYRRIISFRNILIHGYGSVDAAIVWDLVRSRLPALRREVEALLGSAEAK